MSAPAQHLHFFIDDAALAPAPVRATLRATPTADGAVGVAQSALLLRLTTPASHGWAAEPQDDELARCTDEPTLVGLIALRLRESLREGTGQDARVRYGVIRAALERARARGEIWNPVLHTLLGAPRPGYKYGVASTWSEPQVARLAALLPDAPQLPSPAQWTAGAAGWMRRTPSDVVLDALAPYPIGPWQAVLAAAAAPVTPRLVAALGENHEALCALVTRPALSPADAAIVLESRLGPDPDAVLRAVADAARLPDLFELYHRVGQRFGRLPEATTARLLAAVAAGRAGPGGGAATVAEVLRAADPTTPPAELAGLLETPTDDAGIAFLGGHAAFMAAHQADWIARVTRPRPNGGGVPVTLAQRVLAINQPYYSRTEPLRHVVPSVLQLVAVEVSQPDALGRRNSEHLVRVIQHPSATPEVLRAVADQSDLDPVRRALAESPVARQVPEIRAMLLRARRTEIVEPLLRTATPTEFPALWTRLLREAPDRALDLLERGDLPPGARPARASLAGALAGASRETRLRILRLMPLVGPSAPAILSSPAPSGRTP